MNLSGPSTLGTSLSENSKTPQILSISAHKADGLVLESAAQH